jgi:hypothetical protein
MTNDHVETVEQAVYSAKVIAESSNPVRLARMDGLDAWGIIHGCCGDTMEIYFGWTTSGLPGRRS